jgi:hypothetical protein
VTNPAGLEVDAIGLRMSELGANVSKPVDGIIAAVLPEIEEPPAHRRTAAGSGYVRGTLRFLLEKIGQRFSRPPAAELELRLRRDPDQKAPLLIPCYNTPPKIGVFPFSANPIHWGHVIASLAAVDAVGLDVMVFLPAGRLTDNEYSTGRDADEQDRHTMVQNTIGLFEPILQYTDVARGTNFPGEFAVHSLRALNIKTDIDFNLVFAISDETQVREILDRTRRCLQDQALRSRHSRHHLDLTFVDGLGNRAVLFDPERLWRYRQEIGLPLRCRLVTIDMPELAPFRSSVYRASREPTLVSRAVHRYVLDHHLYI